ncbi:MAG: hypothetical protein JWO05_3587 [Gemmatimonadetes bacterium]|nr:hypothetical protein [Gemmatimonadota bacterium]
MNRPSGRGASAVAWIHALGALSAGTSAGVNGRLTQPKPLALLAWLALARPRGLQSRDAALLMFWPDLPTSEGRHALRNALHAIRKALGEPVVVTAGDSLVGVSAEALRCDALELEAALAAGQLQPDTPEEIGELLHGFHVSGAGEFEQWLAAERERFSRVNSQAAVEAARRAASSGYPAQALRLARCACVLAPEDESAMRYLLSLLLTLGDRSAAERELESFARRLATAHGGAPSAMTSALVRDGAESLRRTMSLHGSSYANYVRGTYLFLRSAHPGASATDLADCKLLFERALEDAPDFAPAIAGLSNYWAVASIRAIEQPFDAAFERVMELCRRALELDATLAIPHVHFGVKAMYLDGDWERAGCELSLAVTLDPGYAEARRFYGIWLGAHGRHAEARAMLAEAVRIEPNIPLFQNSLAAELMIAGEYDHAVQVLSRALVLDPRYMAARERLLRCLEHESRFEEAVNVRQGWPTLLDEQFAAAFLSGGAEGYRATRRLELQGQVTQLEARLSAATPNPADRFNPVELRLALAHAELGDAAASRKWVRRGSSARPGAARWFDAQPALRATQGAPG